MKRTSRNICPQCDAGDPTSVMTECECEAVREPRAWGSNPALLPPNFGHQSGKANEGQS